MIRKPCCYRRSALFSETSMYPQEVVATAHQPHPPLKRALFVRSSSGATYQRSQPGPEGGLQTLDVGGVDQRSYRTLWVPITREITSASVPTTIRRRTSTTLRRSWRFMTWAIITPLANTSLGRPTLPV